MVFDAHDAAFAFFDGDCARGLYDSSAWRRHRSGGCQRLRDRSKRALATPDKTAVDTIFVGKDRA